MEVNEAGVGYQSVKDLKAWQEAHVFQGLIWNCIKQFPDEEKFLLKSQAIRSSRSIADNISEGHGRYTFKDQLHFCVIARGSLSECRNQMITAYKCNYIDDLQLQAIEDQFQKTEALLNGYISFLRKNLK